MVHAAEDYLHVARVIASIFAYLCAPKSSCSTPVAFSSIVCYHQCASMKWSVSVTPQRLPVTYAAVPASEAMWVAHPSAPRV